MNEQILLYIALALAAVCVILLIILVSRQSAMTREMNQIRKETQESIQFSLKTFGGYYFHQPERQLPRP